jgi:hypothetical protein
MCSRARGRGGGWGGGSGLCEPGDAARGRGAGRAPPRAAEHDGVHGAPVRVAAEEGEGNRRAIVAHLLPEIECRN